MAVKDPSSTTGYRIPKGRPGAGQFAAAPKGAVLRGSILRLPTTLGALALGIPLAAILSLAGGAIGLSAAVLNTGVLVTSLASRVAGGVMGAAGGLAGGGQSGNVKKDSSKKMQMIQSVLNKKEPTGKGGGIADIKSTLVDYDVPEGAMSMLPTGNEDGMGMLSGMLHQIAVNTSYLGGIDSKINALVGLSSISVIDQAQETKGGDGVSGGSEGAIKRTFNSLKDGLSSMSNTLGGAGRSVLKGIGLAGAFLAFKKFEPQITSGLASLFENVSGFFSTMGEGADPSDGIVGYFDNVMENTILPALTTMATKAFNAIWTGIKMAVNAIAGFEVFKLGGEVGLPTTASATTTMFQDIVTQKGGLKNAGTVSRGALPGLSELGIKDFDGSEYEENAIQAAVVERLQLMYDNFEASGGRIRWTNIGYGFDMGGGIGSLKRNVSVEKLFSSQPIIDGFVRPFSDLKLPKDQLLPVPTGMSDNNLKEYIENLQNMSKLGQSNIADRGQKYSDVLENLMNYGTFGIFPKATHPLPFTDNNFERFRTLELKNIDLLKENKRLNDDGKNGDTSMIDASSFSQHMHETTIAMSTSPFHTDPTQQAINDALRTA